MKYSKPTLKNILKRTLTFILAVITITTSVGLNNIIPIIEVNAKDAASGANGGGGDGSMGYTSDYKYWSRYFSGYRFYIINKDLERVSNTLDIQIQKPTDTSTYLFGTRFDSKNSPDAKATAQGYTIKDTTIQTTFGKFLESELKGKWVIDYMPFPTTSEKGQGEEFQDWFLQDIPHSYNGVTYRPTLTSGKYSPSKDPNRGASVGSEDVNICGTCGNVPCTCGTVYPPEVTKHSCLSQKCLNKGGTIVTEAYENVATTVEKAAAVLLTLKYTTGSGKTTMQNDFKSYVQKYWNHKSKNPSESSSSYDARKYAMGKLYYAYEASIDEKYLAWVIFNNTCNINTQSIYYLESKNAMNGVVAKNKSDDILSTSIPLAVEEAISGCPAFTLLDNKQLLKVDGFNCPQDAINTGDYYLIVEPIAWIYIQNSSGGYPSKGNRTYGTYYNLVNAWQGKDSGGFYATYLKRLGNNCMILNEAFTTSAGRVINSVSIESRGVYTSKSIMNNTDTRYGLSMHLYYNSWKEADTSTCDEKLEGQPGQAPDDSDKLVADPDSPDKKIDPKYEGTEYPKTANIVKFYELYEDDKLIQTLAFTREDTPKEIEIEHEGIFKLEDWFTSTKYEKAEDFNSDVSSSDPRYDKYKQKQQTYKVTEGQTATTVVLLKEDTLYVKLVARTYTEVPHKSGDWTLSESRLTKTAYTNKTDKGDNVLSGKITYNFDAMQEEHKYCVDFTCGTSDPNTDINSLCSQHCTVSTSKDACHQIKYYYKCTTDGCKSKGVLSKYTNCLDDDGYCGGKKKKTDSTYYVNHECKHQKISSVSLSDSNLSAVLFANDIDKSLRTTGSWMGGSNSTTQTKTFTRKLSDTKAEFNGYKETFLVHRGGYDNPQQYNGVVRNGASTAGGNQGWLSNIGFSAALTLPVLREASAITKTLDLAYSLKLDTSDFYTCMVCNNDHNKYGGCDFKTEQTVVDDKRTNAIYASGKVAINTYPGKLTGGTMNMTYDQNVTMSPSVDGFGVASGTMVQQPTKQFYFFPYIQMQYHNLGSTSEQRVNITSIWKRGMQVNDYAEVAWQSNTKENNLHVTSNQWSTHAKALELAKSLGSTLKNVVLPGGAIYSLDTKGSNQKVQVATYQTILAGTGEAQVKYTMSSIAPDLTYNKAVGEHTDFVNQVVTNLESLHLEQYVSTKATDKNAWLNGKRVYNGADISFLKNGSDFASEDDKYYFKDDIDGYLDRANESDIDVKQLSTTSEFYTFYSTVEGDIYVASASNINDIDKEKGVRILKKNQDASKIDQSTTLGKKAKQIDTRTMVVTKLVAAVERNTGNDKSASWASDGHWYNEAFNGVTVVVQKTQLEVGLTSPTIRTTILDPRLIPQQSSKGTIFTKAFLSQYKTSNTPAGTGKPNVIGTFKGRDITLANLDMLFYSNKFYIPDATVQDLS